MEDKNIRVRFIKYNLTFEVYHFSKKKTVYLSKILQLFNYK